MESGATTEFTVGGLLIAPFVRDALIALLIFVVMRPLLRRAPLERYFVNVPLVMMALYVCILGLVIGLS